MNLPDQNRRITNGSGIKNGAWNVISFLPGFAAIGGAGATMHAAKISWPHVALCLVFGLGVAIFLVWVIRVIGEKFSQVILSDHVPGDRAKFRVVLGIACLYLLAFVWLPISAIIGSKAIKLLIMQLQN